MRGIRKPWLLSGWLCFALAAHASSLDDTLKIAEAHERKGEVEAALTAYQDAEKLSPDNPEILCHLAQQYCNRIRDTKNKADAKTLAEKALDCANRALKFGPKNPRSHVCVAVCLAKNFPYLDNQTKVNYSRQIKSKAEQAIALDPKYDLSYHMLGRWNYEVANMNIFVRALVKIAYGGLPKASFDAAIQNFKKAIELSPNRVIHHLQLARMYHLTGKETLAKDELKQCSTFAPMDIDDEEAQRLAKKISQDKKWPDEM